MIKCVWWGGGWCVYTAVSSSSGFSVSGELNTAGSQEEQSVSDTHTPVYQAVPPPTSGYYSQHSHEYGQYRKNTQNLNQNPNLNQSLNQNSGQSQESLVGPDYGYGYQNTQNYNYGGDILSHTHSGSLEEC